MLPQDPSAILNQLLDEQNIRSKYFVDGLLSSRRYNRFWRYTRPDANLFFTAISVFTLQRLYPRLTPAEQPLATQFMARAQAAYPHFRNKDGLNTYNFYGTVPTAHFPHGKIMRHFRHFKLPDDIDDTAMVFLTTRPTPPELAFLVEKLAHHAASPQQPAQNTYPDCAQLRAYSTWFGQTMPVEFDACALTNMLCVVYENNLPPDQHAQDGLRFLASCIQTNRYRTDPFGCAPNYARAPLIQYHMARLIGTHNPPTLAPLRPVVVAHLHQDLAQTTYLPDQLLLAISLLNLGETPRFALPVHLPDDTFENFTFFIAGMLSAYPQPWLRRWANRPFWHIRWRCEGHNLVLLLEYLVLNRRFSPPPA